MKIKGAQAQNFHEYTLKFEAAPGKREGAKRTYRKPLTVWLNIKFLGKLNIKKCNELQLSESL